MPRRLRALLVLGTAVIAPLACRAPTRLPRGIGPAARVPATWPFRGGTAAVAPNAMIASNERLATEAGLEILRRGGNAVDAAVATGFALAVTYPEAGNLGGGGYMVARMADGRTVALDFREVAPDAATRDMYLDSTGAPTDRSLVGHLASGVPGSVAGLVAAQDSLGALSLSDVIAPAIRLAETGFVVDSALSRSVAEDSALIARFAGAAVFLPGGRPIAPGTLLVQPALAQTLRLIATQGAAGFYTGLTAERIAAEMQRGGGLITAADLADYRPLWRTPISASYRGDTLYTMPLSSSGGITMVETLNILEALGPRAPFGSALAAQQVAEAFRRAFVDRNTLLGDPAFVQVPVGRLTSKAYARELASTIQPGRASPTGAFQSAREGQNTTHYSVVDARGNAVAVTTTINGLYGSGVYVPDAGFFLNNEMDDFTSRPGVPNQFGLLQGEANAIAPGKRMLSAMSPTVVVDSLGRVRLVLGARGGPKIITATTQVVLRVLDYGMPLWDAVAAPRVHQQGWPDTLFVERGGRTPAGLDSLRAMGYAVDESGNQANVMAIARVPGGWAGVVDPRTTGLAAGY